MLDLEKLKEYRKEMEANGSWSGEAFKYLIEHAKELDTNEEASRIAFPTLWEVNDMFKDVNLEED